MNEPPKPMFLFDTLLPRLAPVLVLVTVIGLGLRFGSDSHNPVLLLAGLYGLAVIRFLQAYAPAVSAPVENDQVPAYVPVGTTPDTSVLALAMPKVQAIGGAVVLIGILFKLLFWNGSLVMLCTGTMTLLAALALQATTERFSRQTVLLAALGAAVWATPTETLVRQTYRNDPELAASMLYHLQHPRDRAAAQALRQLQQVRRAGVKP